MPVVKTIVVTGANRGLGREFVRQFAARGDRVIAAARKPVDEGEWVTLDVADVDSINAASAKIHELTDRVDVLVNNAGIPHAGEWKDSENFGTLTLDGMESVIRTNCLGPLLFSQALADLLKVGSPSILAGVTSFFSSLGGRPEYFADNFAYSMSKVSMNMWLRSLSFLLREPGVMTVALDPGWARTDMGGPTATDDPVEVVTGLIRVIDGLTPEQSGSYLSWKGETVPW